VKAYVSGGHVFCRIRREDVDVGTCFGCDRLRKVDEKSSPPYLVCELKSVPMEVAEDPLFVEWWFQHHRRAR